MSCGLQAGFRALNAETNSMSKQIQTGYMYDTSGYRLSFYMDTDKFVADAALVLARFVIDT
jgi:hypothetical protein